MDKIDIVYLWCDGSDPDFIARKNKYLGIENKLDTNDEAVGEKRFYDNDELKYSLRSLELYAPWINHVYIVTDRQIPKWLNINYDKVTVVDHSVIMPEKLIPCFSPLVLEYRLHKIPGLAEKFLYANDDMFFGRTTTEQDFFLDGKPIIRLEKIKKRDLEKDISYTETYSFANTVNNAICLVRKKYGRDMYYTLHHNIDSYTKEMLVDVLEKYEDDLGTTLKDRFRNNRNVHRLLIALNALVCGKGVLKEVEISRWHKIKAYFTNINVDSYCNEDNNNKYQREIRGFNPMLFCINSGNDCSIEKKGSAKKFMEKLFPNKSKFEN